MSEAALYDEDCDHRPYPRLSTLGMPSLLVTRVENYGHPAALWERRTDMVLVLDGRLFTQEHVDALREAFGTVD